MKTWSYKCTQGLEYGFNWSQSELCKYCSNFEFESCHKQLKLYWGKYDFWKKPSYYGNPYNYDDYPNSYYEKYKCDECEAKPESKPKLKPEPKPKPAPRPISPSLTGELPRKICL